MFHAPAFANPTSVRSFRNHALPAKRASVCAMATENPAETQSMKPRIPSVIEILPPNADRRALTKPPVHRSIPILGYLTEGLLKLGTNASRARRLGPVYESNFLIKNSVFVTDAEAITKISRNPEIFTTVGALGALAVLFGEDNPMVQDGAPHMLSRNLISGAFNPNTFPFYFSAIIRRIRLTWSRAQSDVNTKGHLKLDPVFREHYLSTIVEMTTGIDMESAEAADLRSSFMKIQKAFFSPMVGPFWNDAIRCRDTLRAQLEAIIRESLVNKADIIEKLREYGDKIAFKGRKDIVKGEVNVLLIAIANSDLKTGTGHTNNTTTITSLINLMMLLWFAGYATSAATTSCCALEIGMNDDIMNALLTEQEAIISVAGDRELTYAQTNKMPLLDSFISEILRMHPAGAILARKSLKDVTILGLYVPAGSAIVMDISASMRDSNLFPNPDILKIDRFVNKEGEPQPPKILSFGAPGSPHYCIGGALARTLMKSTLSVLLREYHLVLDPKQSINYATIPDETPESKVVCIGLPDKG